MKRQTVSCHRPPVVACFPASKGEVAQRPNHGVRAEVSLLRHLIRPLERVDGIAKRPPLEGPDAVVHVAGHLSEAYTLFRVGRAHHAGPPAGLRP